MNKSYFELLKDPRWQKVRLQVMERARFTCESCLATDKTLTVHHAYYEYGLNPWEYPIESLSCLCEDCHKQRQEMALDVKRLRGKIAFNDAFLLGVEMGIMLQECEYGQGVAVPDKYWEMDDGSAYEILRGIGAVFGLTVWEMKEEVDEHARPCIVSVDRIALKSLVKRGATKHWQEIEPEDVNAKKAFRHWKQMKEAWAAPAPHPS